MNNFPRILAHRGASGLEFENSMAAFRAAREAGADGGELDIHLTGDGALLVHHDPDVPGLGPIRLASLESLRRAPLPNAEAIPTLHEALAELGGLEVWIELKGLPAEGDPMLLETLARSPTPAQCAVHSFDHRIIARLGRKQAGLRRGILSTSYPVDPVGPMQAVGATVLWQAWPLIDAQLVEAVHRTGGEVVAWTVNDAKVAGGLTQLGIDALCGNYPDRLRAR